MRTLTVIALCLLVSACTSNSGSNSQSSPSASQTQSTEAQSPAAQSTEAQPTAAPAVATLKDSTVTFKDAQAVCAGALGSVTFSLGHARAHGATGVELQEHPSGNAGVVTMVFTDNATGKSSTVEVNGHDRSVTGAGVMVRRNGAVGCVMAQ
jgi:hypothetical protein